jgi:hypothetical protein
MIEDLAGNDARRMRDRDDMIETRERMVALLREAGRPMNSAEIAKAIGRTRMQVCFAAGRWTTYFERERKSRNGNCVAISLHWHLLQREAV